MPKDLDFKNLRFCLDNYFANKLLIRDCGGYDNDGNYRIKGSIKVKENLEGRTLNFRKDSSGLYLSINQNEVFHFPLKDVGTRLGVGFSLAYERVQPDGMLVMLSHGINPYDLNLPEPKNSCLRDIIDNHLLEITFKGKVDLKFHSWMENIHWKFWTIDKPGKSL